MGNSPCFAFYNIIKYKEKKLKMSFSMKRGFNKPYYKIWYRESFIVKNAGMMQAFSKYCINNKIDLLITAA